MGEIKLGLGREWRLWRVVVRVEGGGEVKDMVVVQVRVGGH